MEVELEDERYRAGQCGKFTLPRTNGRISVNINQQHECAVWSFNAAAGVLLRPADVVAASMIVWIQ